MEVLTLREADRSHMWPLGDRDIAEAYRWHRDRLKPSLPIWVCFVPTQQAALKPVCLFLPRLPVARWHQWAQGKAYPGQEKQVKVTSVLGGPSYVKWFVELAVNFLPLPPKAAFFLSLNTHPPSWHSFPKKPSGISHYLEAQSRLLSLVCESPVDNKP